MAMPKGRVHDKYAPKSLQECIEIPHKPIQLIADLFLAGDEYSVGQLAKAMKLSNTNARIQLDFLIKHKLVYLHRWDKTHSHNWTAMFKAGDKPHAAPPNMKNALAIKKEAPPPPPPKPLSATAADAAAQLAHLKELASVLVPKRTPEEQREINQQYWEHLARRAA